jgi:hypothetical protein
MKVRNTVELTLSLQLLLQSPVVDKFWIEQCSSAQPQANTITSSVRSLPAKQASTKDERYAALMSTMQVLAQLASRTISGTTSATEDINNMIEELQRTKAGEGNAEALCGGIDESNTGVVPMKEYIANPPIKKKQSQARKQPQAIGAPTTSSYKAAGNRSRRERKESEKAKSAKALGLM